MPLADVWVRIDSYGPHQISSQNERFFDGFQAAANNILESVKAFAASLENYTDVEGNVR